MKKAFIATTICLSVIIVGLCVALYFNSMATSTANASLEGVYQKSFFDLVDNVNNLEVNVSKLMVSNDANSQKEILTNLKQQSSEAQANLSALPVSSNTLNTTSKFINQFNGYCTSLLKFDTEKVNNEEYENIKTVYDAIAKIKYELNNIQQKLMQGYTITQNINSSLDKDKFSINFSGLSSDSIEYPSMIYDGPFSDATTNRTINGLPETETTQAQAEETIGKIIENITSLEFLGETLGKFETFDYGVNTANGNNYYIQISKKGNFVLTINANNIEGEAVISEAEAVSYVEELSKTLGLENMKSVWKVTQNGTTYVNLAPIINNVVIYPDLVKAKIDLSTGKLLGWEATGYAYNHKQRDNLEPTITLEEAQTKISENLVVTNTRTCIIPLEFGGEILAYEFSGEYNNFTYYLYIDAITGNQARVLRVIQTDEGELVL